jgi:hypothetical protein
LVIWKGVPVTLLAERTVVVTGAADRSSYMTGTVLEVTGGRHM